jgi:hypothetical protein
MRSPGRLLPLAAIALASTSCVEVFEGSWVEVVFFSSTNLPGEGAGRARPPAGTHYELWVSSGDRMTRIFQFRIARQINSAFPCFVEDGEAKFPGLHTTQIVERVLADEEEAANGQPFTQDQIDRIADAEKRDSRREDVEEGVKAVVGYDPTTTNEDLADLAAEVQAMAPITDVSDEANAKRREICERFFDEHPRFYVGFDSVFSLPLNGDWYGVVDGNDPRTGAPLGGAGFTVPFKLDNFDSLQVRWDFDNPEDRATAECLFTEDRVCPPSSIGYYYLGGTPREVTRRTTRVTLVNENFPGPQAEMAIFPSLGDDDVQF